MRHNQRYNRNCFRFSMISFVALRTEAAGDALFSRRSPRSDPHRPGGWPSPSAKRRAERPSGVRISLGVPLWIKLRAPMSLKSRYSRDVTPLR